jgi:uncharacterized protein
MLEVELAEIHRGPLPVDLRADREDPLFAEADCALRSSVRVHGRVTASGADEYYFSGRLEAEVTVACRRCLTDVPTTVETEVEALFTAEDSGDPSAYPLVIRDGKLDLGAMVRENLLLAMPEFAVCREECRGLCARCGNDLNDGACDCQPEPDPRWAALEALKARSDEPEEM